jgi:hypothetical protein
MTNQYQLGLRQWGGLTSSKKFYYKNKSNDVVYLQSSYEMITAQSLDDNNIRWSRPSSFGWIKEDGTLHKYYPDFYLIDYDIYLDPKNDYLFIKDKGKIQAVSKQNNIRILMLTKENLDWISIKQLIEP